MTFAFDLISDLHVDTWPQFDWTGQATSPYCVVAGDVGRDPAAMEDALGHLACCYQAVFYIDGNDEHRHQLDDLNGSYQAVEQTLKSIPGVVYLHSDVVIINGVAILAANGWWSYDFDADIDLEETRVWTQDRYGFPAPVSNEIELRAYQDAMYLINSVKRLQTHQEVRRIVLVTHTVPASWLIEHDLDLRGEYRFNTMGNSLMSTVLTRDTEHKIDTWCFGHYHKSVDRISQGVRYVNNCRGRGNTEWKQSVYHPKRIEIKF